MADGERINADRRHHARVHVDARVSLFAYRDGEQVTFSGQLDDASQGGVSVYVPTEFEIGDTLRIEVALPYSTSPIRARVVVRSRDTYRYGLQFVELDPTQQESLARACKLIGLMVDTPSSDL